MNKKYSHSIVRCKGIRLELTLAVLLSVFFVASWSGPLAEPRRRREHSPTTQRWSGAGRIACSYAGSSVY